MKTYLKKIFTFALPDKDDLKYETISSPGRSALSGSKFNQVHLVLTSRDSWEIVFHGGLDMSQTFNLVLKVCFLKKLLKNWMQF